jgi:hypothetical protein
MRLIAAFVAASLLVFVIFWVGSRIAVMVEQPHREHNDFTVGEKMSLCGRVVDTRHKVSGYDFDEWQGSRCESLSKLDECLLECLSRAGTLEIGAACYSDCVQKQ